MTPYEAAVKILELAYSGEVKLVPVEDETYQNKPGDAWGTVPYEVQDGELKGWKIAVFFDGVSASDFDYMEAVKPPGGEWLTSGHETPGYKCSVCTLEPYVECDRNAMLSRRVDVASIPESVIFSWGEEPPA